MSISLTPLMVYQIKLINDKKWMTVEYDAYWRALQDVRYNVRCFKGNPLHY